LISETLKILNDALGETHPSPKILEGIKVIGAGFVETPSVIEGNYFFEFFTEGVSFNFENDCLTQISIYLTPFGEYESFRGEVFDIKKPERVDWNFIRSLLGEPKSQGGGEVSLSGYINPWVKYNFDGVYMNLEFDQNESLSAIHLIAS